MRSVDQIDNPETLKQVALLLQKENQRLHDRLQFLLREISILRGDSSPDKEPQRGHGPREQKLLPIVEELHELPQHDRQCPACQGELDEMKGQFEESEEVTVVQRTFKTIKRRRKKYRCRCNGAVVTAPSPNRLVPGGRYSTEFAVEVAVATDKAVYYRTYLNRSAKAGGDLLAGYRGNIMVDGYIAYDSLQRAGPEKKFLLSHCWAHVRRKFVEIEEFYPVESKEIVDLIRDLYDIERQAPSLDRLDEDLRKEALESPGEAS